MNAAISNRSIVRVLLFGLCCALVGCAPSSDQLAVSVRNSSTDDPSIARDLAVSNIYAAAKRGDRAGLLLLQPTGSPPDPAVALGLYVIDRTQYQSMFVANYPHTVDGVNNDYGLRLDRAGVFGRGAQKPVRTLAKLAIAGDDDARRQLLTALPYATSANAAVYAKESALVLVAASPEAALITLAELPPHLRLTATSEVDWCYRRPKRILAFSPRPLPTPTELPTPLPSGSARASDVSASGVPTETPATATPLPGATPSPSPTPLAEALVQDQIRQAVGTCNLIGMQTKAHKKNHPRHVPKPKNLPA